MKYFLLCLFLFFKQDEPLLDFNNDTQKWQYMRVVEVPDVKEDVIFNKTREYVTLFYKSGKDVTQLAEKESGKIIVKGAFVLKRIIYDAVLRHTIVIDIKDGKFRVRIDNYIMSAGNYERNLEQDGITGKAKIMREGAERSKEFIDGLQKYILDNAKKKDDF